MTKLSRQLTYWFSYVFHIGYAILELCERNGFNVCFNIWLRFCICHSCSLNVILFDLNCPLESSTPNTPNHIKWDQCFLVRSRWVGCFIVGHGGCAWGSGSWLWSPASVDSTLCSLFTNRCDCQALYALPGVSLDLELKLPILIHPWTSLLSSHSQVCLRVPALTCLNLNYPD